MKNPINNPAHLQQTLLQWFSANRRRLPWRNANNWYPVFLSEFLLQQTQVAQVLPYFEKLLQTYPTIQHLAAADEDLLLSQWAGLGYYSRARNLLKAAKAIVHRFDGKFPSNYKDALSLPGIGPYTASAILSIAFNQPYAVVDGNIIRVITRLFNIQEDVRAKTTQKQIRSLATVLLPKDKPGLFNEAMMELGALICRPTTPLCDQCPLQAYCLAKRHNAMHRVPFKSPPAPKKKRYHFVFLLEHNGRLLTVQRPHGGLLARMWEFPSVETSAAEFQAKDISSVPKDLPVSLSDASLVLPVMKHIYSHIVLQYRPIIVSTDAPFAWKSDFYVQQKWLALPEISFVALHNAHKKILRSEAFEQWWRAKMKDENRLDE